MRIILIILLQLVFVEAFAQSKWNVDFRFHDVTPKDNPKYRTDTSTLPFDVFNLDGFNQSPGFSIGLGYEFLDNIDVFSSLGFAQLGSSNRSRDFENPLVVNNRYLQSELGIRFKQQIKQFVPYLSIAYAHSFYLSSNFQNFEGNTEIMSLYESTIQPSFGGFASEAGVRYIMNREIGISFGFRNVYSFSEFQRIQQTSRRINGSGFFFGTTYGFP